MKFATVVATALLVLSSSVLTQAARPMESLKTSKAQIVIQGVPQEFSKDDLKIIKKSAVSAYNAVVEDSDYSLVSIKPHFSFGTGGPQSECLLCPFREASSLRQASSSLGEEKVIIADVSVEENRVKQACIPCCGCRSEEENALESLWEIEEAELDYYREHKLFVESFCNLLATSASANLANARDCSFTFLETPPTFLEIPAQDVGALKLVKAQSDQAVLGFLPLTGLAHELSATDIAIVEAATLKSLNEAFGAFVVENLHVRNDFEVEEEKNVEAGAVLMMDIEIQGGGVNESTNLLNKIPDATAFARSLCHELHNSGSFNLASVDDCAMDFFYQHDLDASNEASV